MNTLKFLFLPSLAMLCLVLSSGCSVKNETALHASFDMSFVKDPAEAKKNALYEDVISDLNKNPGMRCVLDSDRMAAEAAPRIFEELVSRKTDPIRFADTAGNPKAAASRIAEAFKTNLYSRLDKVFKVTGRIYTCRRLEMPTYNYELNELDHSKGTISITATISRECLKGQSIPGLVEGKSWITDNAKMRFDVGYVQLSPGQVRFDAQNISYEHSPSVVFNKEMIIDAFNNITTSYKSEYQVLKEDTKQTIANRLGYKRFSKKGSLVESKTERTYAIDFNSAVSRIQRALDHYNYSPGDSTFQFTDNKQFEYCGGKTEHYQHIRTKIKLFPEANKKTAVVYESSIEPVYDKLSSQMMDKQIQIEHKAFITAVEKILR